MPNYLPNGNLEIGIHIMEWNAFVGTYGYNGTRKGILAGMTVALSALKKYGCQRVYVDGSFVSTKEEPGDFDGCWDPEGVDLKGLTDELPCFVELRAPRDSQKALFRGEIFPSTVPADNKGNTFLEFFQKDRDETPKGIIQINLNSFA